MAEAANSKPVYFPRRFQVLQEDSTIRQVSEAEFIALPGPKIVLGEPGMGKSEFIYAAGRQLQVNPIQASQFMLSKRAERLLSAGKPLLIDGLDEAMARNDGDAIDMVLTQLADLDCPNFVLTCRAKEWQARTAINLQQNYGSPVHVATLEAFEREEAAEFLRLRYPAVQAELVLSHLDGYGIADLYTNPLTLGLMGTVGQRDTNLPSTRAALFKRVCELTWPERNPGRHDLALSQLNGRNALSAAGAIMAALLLAGADSVVTTGPVKQEGEILLADVQELPLAQAAALIAGSKLFVSAGIGRVRPIHRVIAEYLGACWLAHVADSPRLRKRVLSHFHDAGAVPASLRGLHAWLAHHSPDMALPVIRADPFGVLRYGETTDFTAAQTTALFDALQHLSKDDPYFMGHDRDNRTTAALMILPLKEKINAAISATDSNNHLRLLLMEGIVGTVLAGQLTDTLEDIVFSNDRWYAERRAASQALQPFRPLAWWQKSILQLHDQASEDASRLARQVTEDIACDIPVELLVSVLYAELGLSFCSLPRNTETDVYMHRDYRQLIALLPPTRLASVLDMLAEYAFVLRSPQRAHEIDFSGASEVASGLLARALNEQVVTERDAAKIWNWLGLVASERYYFKREKKALQEALNAQDSVRHAIQQYALYSFFAGDHVWSIEIELQMRLISLTHRCADLVWFFEQLQQIDNANAEARKAWCDLMQLAVRSKDSYSDVRAASQLFQRDDPQLALFVHQLEHPEKPDWLVDQERRNAEFARKQSSGKCRFQQRLQSNLEELRAGELSVVPRVARIYLGIFHDSEKSSTAMDRLAHATGHNLAAHAMAGFEATLGRSDLPSPADIADSLVTGEMWNYGYSMLAGLHARCASGASFTDLPADILVSGLMLAYDVRYSGSRQDFKPLISSLEAFVLPTLATRERFARLWIEPALQAKATYVGALDHFAYNASWQETALRLVPEWLQVFIDLPLQIEMVLLDSIAYPSASFELATLAKTRRETDYSSNEHVLAWLAVDLLVSFDESSHRLTEVASRHPEFLFYIRDRLYPRDSSRLFQITVSQAEWLVVQFRTAWPHTSLRGSSSGNRNPHDATEFLRSVFTRLADDTSPAAVKALHTLIASAPDTYTDLMRHMAVEQRQKRAEKNYSPVVPQALATMLMDGPPVTIDDLRTLILGELGAAQKILRGDDLDQVRDFWNDQKIPHDENRCRDRLAAFISPELTRYGIQRITEADMPRGKRVDLAFAHGRMQLPLEVKGQWHDDVWCAAAGQLDAYYLIDWRSQDRGIYCVLWFGPQPSNSGRRLKPPPSGTQSPDSADAMREAIEGLIPVDRRHLIDVFVLDFTGGRLQSSRKP